MNIVCVLRKHLLDEKMDGWMDGNFRLTRGSKLSHRPSLQWNPRELSDSWAFFYSPLLLPYSVEHIFFIVGIKKFQPANTHAGALAKHNNCCLETKESLMKISANFLKQTISLVAEAAYVMNLLIYRSLLDIS